MMVARKKTDVVQLSKIRMREELRRKLARDAERKGSTLSGEIVDRLEQSYQVDDRVELITTVRNLATSELAASLREHPGANVTVGEFLRGKELILAPHAAAAAKLLGNAIFTKSPRKEFPQQIDAEKAPERDQRDSDIVDMLLSRNETSSHLLRAITLELAMKPDWSASKSGIADMAEAIRLHVFRAERRLEKVEGEQ
jgi:hypothetical protein